ncbi:MobQ family relaxase [Leuconostoc suionicum]|uniref:MobQ family relaxase n=1 Tax=Leuconostoc suionicum TaxID=1511761 RepID=UPI0024ACCB91|nr:MobQ family relaxase [Leuconostoc suionicum]MDI6682082.1 MobQ family relaxase [Leuconostoc suionicum]
MAIFHMNFSNISAGNGRSAIASASYRSGEKLHSDMEGKNYFYARDVMPETYILAPDNAPDWVNNREILWNEVEKKDRRSNARYAKEFNVALPVELSEIEQKELLLKYVQNTFVNEGMVADVAIHRDHPDNPHAHVMLTNRPFNEDGTWGIKSKKEYILDEYGNKTYTGTSKYPKSKKIWLVDWDKKGKVEQWRKDWAKSVNRVFEQKNMPDRISEKTLDEQGIDGVATQHVGVNGQRPEREKFNQLALENRKHKAQLKNVDEKIHNERRIQTLQNHLSFSEKRSVSQLSKELQTFVSLENLDDKKRMLFNWKNSLLIKQAVGEDISKQMFTINQQEQSLEKANDLLDKVVDRTINSIYPDVDIEQTTIAERRELIKETDSEKTIFTGQELKDRLAMIRTDILNKEILSFTKRPYVSWLVLEHQEERTKNNMTEILSQKGYKFADIERSKGSIIRNFSDEEQDILKRGIKDLQATNEIKNVVQIQYAGVLKKTFPDMDIDNVTMVDREKIYTAIVYFNPELKQLSKQEFNELKDNPPIKFSTREHQQGLAYLSGTIKLDDIKNPNLIRVLANEGTKQLFIGESSQDPNITKEQIEQVKQVMTQNNGAYEDYRKANISDYQSVNYRETTPAEYLNNVFSSVIMKLLYVDEARRKKGLKETEWEMEKKKRQHEKHGRQM